MVLFPSIVRVCTLLTLVPPLQPISGPCDITVYPCEWRIAMPSSLMQVEIILSYLISIIVFTFCYDINSRWYFSNRNRVNECWRVWVLIQDVHHASLSSPSQTGCIMHSVTEKLDYCVHFKGLYER